MVDVASIGNVLAPLLTYDRANAEDTQRHTALLSKLEANGEVRADAQHRSALKCRSHRCLLARLIQDHCFSLSLGRVSVDGDAGSARHRPELLYACRCSIVDASGTSRTALARPAFNLHFTDTLSLFL